MKWILRILAALGGLILLAVLVLLAMGQRSGAGHYNSSIVIGASAERIWPWLEDGEKAKQWVSWLVEVRRTGTGKSAVGSAEVWVMKDPNMNDQLIPIEGTCTEYDRPSRLSVRLASDAFKGNQTYVLTPAGNGATNLAVNSSFEFPGWFAKLLEPLVAPAVSKKMKEDPERLKKVVESSAT